MAYKPEERQENNRERQQGRKRMQDTAHRAFEKNTKRRLTAVGDWQRGEADGTGNRAAMAPVFLGFHGWGSDERDFLPVCRHLASGHDYASLRAPVPMSALFADEGYHVPGYSWFTQVTVSGKELDRQAAIDACLIERWCEENLEDDRKIVPLGFSQGGMMVTQLLRTIPERIAGAIVFSGFHAPGLLDGHSSGRWHAGRAEAVRRGDPGFLRLRQQRHVDRPRGTVSYGPMVGKPQRRRRASVPRHGA